jgi:hypothetical protein
MKPFRSAGEMLDAHELMFGAAGRQCAEIVLKWATTLFAAPLNVLNIRVVLAPVEIGPLQSPRRISPRQGPKRLYPRLSSYRGIAGRHPRAQADGQGAGLHRSRDDAHAPSTIACREWVEGDARSPSRPCLVHRQPPRTPPGIAMPSGRNEHRHSGAQGPAPPLPRFT